MKKDLFSLLICTTVFLLFIVGCNITATAPTETVVITDTASLSAKSTSTETAFSTATDVPTVPPTAAPEPINCGIAFESDRDGNKEIYSMASDGSKLVNLSNNSGDDFEPAFSADGSQIAFASNRDTGDAQGQFIYIMNADGSALRKLTPQDGSGNPNWSPSGNQIVYDNGQDIYTIKADGSEPATNLTNTPEKDIQPDWSPDGQKIVWLSGSENNWNIFVLDLPSGQITQLTDDGTVGDVSWTVDGQLFTHWGKQENGCFNCVMDADGTHIKDAGGKGSIQEYLPYWTDEGDRVECVGVSMDGKPDEIYLVSEIYPDIFLNLTNNPAQDRNPDWPANCGPLVNSTSTKEEQSPHTLPSNSQSFVIGYELSKENKGSPREAELLKACLELNLECVQSDSLSELAEQNVDAIISFSNQWHVLGSHPAFHEIASRGIPLIVLDAETDEQGAYSLSIESDSLRSGLKWMFKEMGGAGEFAYFNVGKNDTDQQIIDELLKDFPGIKATSIASEFGDNSLSEESIKTLLKANPNLKGIWSDEGLMNIFWGIKDAGLKQLPAILCEPRADMLQSWKDRTIEDPAFKCFATIKPGGTAYEGVYVAYYILNGLKIDPGALGGAWGNTLIYDYPTITNENLDEWLGKINTFRKVNGDTLEIPPMTPNEIKENWFLD